MSAVGALGGSGGLAGRAPLRRTRGADAGAAGPAPAERGGRDVEGLGLQEKAGNRAVGAMLSPSRGDLVRHVIGSPGRSMEPGVAAVVQKATGADPSRIRVHDGPDAARAARAVGAEMFASGPHLVAPSGLDVTTREGAFKTIHEVHHIVNQQAKGPVEGTDTGDGLRISDPGDRHEQEADAVARAAVGRRFGR
ncbi:MAG: DUF4157 domain-containing protein [Actinomycetota bacterium]|nr:DUF4157 domain-containing protein [Actinomycetota bacterium]